ncbi:hypothetical protein JIN84_12690 [Luteolibacter yonseiensis]|uniref:Uncharacterized protein n=1 Tax=Luteolibacter yonseiensis TaxID=1144680 RepID=A0A934R3N1_9BACT|nr:hypothetical protein [Luteolibacter yonseiensis]MBK1816476.1 hypothetical protein [Luteolibacter yonseiensis]
MNLLATCKTGLLALGLLLSLPCHAAEVEETIDGPNVRKMKHEDGSESIFVRSPDSKTLTKKTRVNGVVTMVTTYKMDSSGNPLGCKIKDGQGNELFKVSYGYHKVTGLLVSELMFDARVKRTRDGKEIPVQEIKYLYDAEGKRSAPMAFNYLPGKYYEEVFGKKSTALEGDPFKQTAPSKKGR